MAQVDASKGRRRGGLMQLPLAKPWQQVIMQKYKEREKQDEEKKIQETLQMSESRRDSWQQMPTAEQ